MPSLKIIKISNFSISCDGGEEVQLLTAGVDPSMYFFLLFKRRNVLFRSILWLFVSLDDIEVKFYEVDKENHLIWEAYGQNISVDHDKTINFKYVFELINKIIDAMIKIEKFLQNSW